jgi:hypothetical protein
VTSLALFLADAASACAVCTDPTDKRADAYFDMTMMMSLLPLAALALAGFWLYRQYAR